MSNIGGSIESTNNHDVETPTAEHLLDAAVDRSAHSVLGMPPNRGNSPTVSGPEGINTSSGALQVVSSSSATHDETWNSFLDVCPFSSVYFILNYHICCPRAYTAFQPQRNFAEGKASKVSRSPKPPCTANLICIAGLPIVITPLFLMFDTQVYRYCPPRANPRTSRGSPDESILWYAAPYHVQNTMYDATFTAGSRRRVRIEWGWGEILSLLPKGSMSQCAHLAADTSKYATHTSYP
jgi:hypothetical protein